MRLFKKPGRALLIASAALWAGCGGGGNDGPVDSGIREEMYYQVTVSSEGTGATGGGQCRQGQSVWIVAGTPPPGRVFDIWTSDVSVNFADAKSAATGFDMPNCAVTVTANFKSTGWTVILDHNHGSSGGPRTTTDTSGYLASLDAPTWNGYTFNGWFTAPSGGTEIEAASYKFTSNTTIYAQWTDNRLTVARGTFADDRDGKTYKKVTIAGQTWMAENLKYDTADGSGSWCYGQGVQVYDYDLEIYTTLTAAEIQANCVTYGRLYTWKTAMAGSQHSPRNPSGVKGVCPRGWHLPSKAELEILLTAVGQPEFPAGTRLKSTTGWRYHDDKYIGTDDFGFSALPYDTWGSNPGTDGTWWTTTEKNLFLVYYWDMRYDRDDVAVYDSYKDDKERASVRCVED